MGRIADRGSEFVSAREWMRICFELLELLKAHKKSIRRAAINTFGYIAKVSLKVSFGFVTSGGLQFFCISSFVTRFPGFLS